MLLKQKSSGHLVEVEDLGELTNPFTMYVHGRFDYGEEVSDPEEIDKGDLIFPSGESLPVCWRDAHYRDAELERRQARA